MFSYRLWEDLIGLRWVLRQTPQVVVMTIEQQKKHYFFVDDIYNAIESTLINFGTPAYIYHWPVVLPTFRFFNTTSQNGVGIDKLIKKIFVVIFMVFFSRLICAVFSRPHSFRSRICVSFPLCHVFLDCFRYIDVTIDNDQFYLMWNKIYRFRHIDLRMLMLNTTRTIPAIS